MNVTQQNDQAEDEQDTTLLQDLNNAIKEQEQLADSGREPCVAHILLALKNQDVQKHFVEHIQSNEAFRIAYCIGGFGVSEESRIIFEFLCVPPKICLWAPRFLVLLNVFTGKVMGIIDPAPKLIPVSEQAPGIMFRL